MKNGIKFNETGESEQESNSQFTMIEKTCKEYKLTWKDIWPQVLASCIAFSVVIQAGANLGYSSILIDAFKKSEDDAFHINTHQESLIASLVIISLPIGSIPLGPLTDKFGRKTLCMVGCISIIISWILFIIGNSINAIYCARIIAGIGSGIGSVACVYVAEITCPRIRAMMLSINSVAASLGILLVHFLNIFSDWKKIAIYFTILNSIFLCMIFFIPESPYWLICFNKKSSAEDNNEKRIRLAKNSLKKLNPGSIIYEQACERIEEASLKKKTTSADNDANNCIGKFINYCKMIGTPVFYKPIILLIAIFIAQQLSGIYVVITYKVGLVGEYNGPVLLGIIRLSMSIVTAICSLKFGRRILLIISGLGMTISMFFSAVFIFYSNSQSENNDREITPEHEWVVVVSVLFYISMCTLGFSTIPWTLIGELLPISFRGVGSGLMVAFAYIMMFSVTLCYPHVKHVGMQNVFFFFSFFSLIGVIIVYLFLPETFGKNFIDIEKSFEKSKRIKSKQNIVA